MAPQGSGLEKHRWDALCSRIADGRATPVIGAGASASILGTGAEIAEVWSRDVGYPGPDRWSLPAVGQYVAVTRDPASPAEAIEKLFKKKLDGFSVADIPDPHDPYRTLPKLPFRVYVTTNYDDLLVSGLRAANRPPRVATVRWVPPDRHWTPIDQDLEGFEPSEAEPLVFHLHGRYQDRSSMVLTQADYLDFLTQMAREDLLPPVVRDALARNALIFIGYSFADTNVQLLLRSWTPQRRGVAVQLGDASQPARDDYERYYPEYVKALTNHELDMYWGTASEFCAELCKRCGGC